VQRYDVHIGIKLWGGIVISVDVKNEKTLHDQFVCITPILTRCYTVSMLIGATIIIGVGKALKQVVRISGQAKLIGWRKRILFHSVKLA